MLNIFVYNIKYLASLYYVSTITTSCNIDPNQVMVMQGMGDEEAMMNLAIALSLNEVSLKLIMMAITLILSRIQGYS